MGRGTNNLLYSKPQPQRSGISSSFDQKRHQPKWVRVNNDHQWRKALIGKQVIDCSNPISQGYRTKEFTMIFEDQTKAKISIQSVSYGHNDFGSSLTASLDKQEQQPSLAAEEYSLIAQANNLAERNPNSIAVSQILNQNDDLNALIVNKRIVSVSDLTNCGYEASDFVIGFDDSSLIKIAILRENYGHNDFGEALYFDLMRHLDYKQMREEVNMHQLAELSKREIKKKLPEIKEFFNDPSIFKGKKDHLAFELLNTITKNNSLKTGVRLYKELLVAIPKPSINNWNHRGNKIVFDQQKELKVYLKSDNCSLTKLEKREIKKRFL